MYRPTPDPTWEALLLWSPGLSRAVLLRARADLAVVGAAWLLLLAATTVLSATILYSDTVATGGLRAAFEAAPPSSRTVDVRVSVPPAALDGTDRAARPLVWEALRSVGGTVVRVDRADPYAAAGTDAATTKDLLAVESVEGLASHATLAAGRWPTPGASPVEATLSSAAAAALAARVGDRVSLVDIRSTSVHASLMVVGIWRPNDPEDDYWLGDPLQLHGIEPGAGFATRGPYVVAAADLATMTSTVAVEFRGLVPAAALSPSVTDELSRDVQALRSRVPAALPRLTPPTISTGLPDLLDGLGRSIAVSRAAILLLTLQFAVLAVYAVLLVAGTLLERRRAETALLRSRGASTAHLAAMAVVEATLLAVPAVALGPVAAVAVVRLVTLLGPPRLAAAVVEPALGPVVALGAIGAGFACVLALALPTIASGAAGTAIRSALGRPLARTLGQRLGLDVALVGIAVIGLWQLRLYGAPLTRNARGVLGADPLLVAAPAVALVAGTLVAVRILPRLAELSERLLARARGLLASLGSRQLARRPLRYTRASLLLVLAVALGTFAAAYGATWSRSQADQAAYQAAADLRILTSQYRTLPAWAAGSVVGAAPGVRAAVPVTRVPLDLGRTVPDATLLGVDAARVSAVATLDPDGGSRLDPALAALASTRPPSGLPLPGVPRRVRVTLDAALHPVDDSAQSQPPASDFASTAGVTAGLVLVDGTGRLVRIPLGSARLVGDGQAIVAPLTLDLGDGAEASVTFPLRLEAVEIAIEPPLFVITGGSLRLRSIDVSDSASGTDWTPVPLDPTGRGWRWSRISGSEAADYTPPAADPGRIQLGSPASPNVVADTDVAGATFRLWDAGAVGDVVPAIASARFLDQAGLGEGESVTVDSGGRPITLRVIASTELFAPLDPSVPFVVVDGPTLDLDRFAATGDPAPVSEWWLAVDAAQRATTAARLAGPPMSARQVVVRDDVEASLLNDPVSLGVIGALGLGAVAALVFAAVGFLVNASVGTAERRGELAVLRAVGVSGRQLVGWLVVESAVVLAVGLVAGSVLGLVLAEVVLPFASLTASGAPPVPSATVVVPAATLVPIDVAAVVLLVAAWVVAARQVPAIHVSDALRGRDE